MLAVTHSSRQSPSPKVSTISQISASRIKHPECPPMGDTLHSNLNNRNQWKYIETSTTGLICRFFNQKLISVTHGPNPFQGRGMIFMALNGENIWRRVLFHNRVEEVSCEMTLRHGLFLPALCFDPALALLSECSRDPGAAKLAMFTVGTRTKQTFQVVP